MRKISYYELGATLYIPILHKNLEIILKREKYDYLKSIVICLEDSTALCDMKEGMEQLQQCIKNLKQTCLKVFIRPRDIENLKTILNFENIEVIDGFALAKFDTQNSEAYLCVFREYNHFYLMPILETKEVFSSLKLQSILEVLKPFREQILVVRIGGEDILSHLGMMRNCKKTIYDTMPLYLILSTIINLFKPYGFFISSVVYACFKEKRILHQELLGDIEHQLFNKTSIHPEQVKIIQSYYQVTPDAYEVAKRLLESDDAIFSHKGRMYEKTTHSNWAKSVIQRYQNYGVTDAK